jgi:hypothetical protein
LAKIGTTIGDTSKTQPELRWCLDILSTLQPDNKIFRRNYEPPAKKKKQPPKEVLFPKDFFDGQPEPNVAVLKKGSQKTMNMMRKI